MTEPDPLERIIRPIVEGQIRGFLKEHPAIVDAVNWYKPRRDKATTFVNSLAKRIILDLVCPVNRERIEGALFEIWEREKGSDVERNAASEGAGLGTLSEPAPISTVELGSCGEGDQIGPVTDLVALALRHAIEDGTYRPDHLDR